MAKGKRKLQQQQGPTGARKRRSKRFKSADVFEADNPDAEEDKFQYKFDVSGAVGTNLKPCPAF